MYMGSQGLYSPTFDYAKKENCIVCATATKNMILSSKTLLKDFMDLLINDLSLQLKKPSIMSESSTIYMQAPPSLEIALRKNLYIELGNLVQNGENLVVTDPMLKDISLVVTIEFIE